MNASSDRAALLRLAARLFVREIDDELAAALDSPDARAALDELAPGCGEWLAGWNEERREEAAVEYASLFLVPARESLSLRAGAWLPADETTVAAGIDELGQALELDVTGAGVGELPRDHLAVLLALAADLLDSPATGTDAQAEAVMDRLLRPWVADFAGFVDQRARVPLHRAASALLVELAG